MQKRVKYLTTTPAKRVGTEIRRVAVIAEEDITAQKLAMAEYTAKKSKNINEVREAVLFLEKNGAFDILESIAGYAEGRWNSIIAIDALARNHQFERIANALFYCMQKRAIRYGLLILIRHNQLNMVYHCEKDLFHFKQAIRGVNRELRWVVESAIRKKDVRLLAQFASSDNNQNFDFASLVNQARKKLAEFESFSSSC
ncbi:MAG: hypothetical protein QXN37_04240 [Candidatus Anstonellaceae archaeon]